MDEYKTVKEYGECEITINKSLFVGACTPVKSQEDALAFISGRRALYKEASHHCFAYIVGVNMGIMRYSDDGEPGGTAGMPIIETIKAQGLTDIAVVVTRWFGGVLLGAGGLARAYARGCREAIEAAKPVIMRLSCEYMAEIPYSMLGKVENELKTRPYALISREFTDKATLTLRALKSDEESMLADIANLTSGNAEFLKTGEGYYGWDI